MSDRSVNRMARNISAKLGVPAKGNTPSKSAVRHDATKASAPSKESLRKKAK
jgi:hypothetical protein